MILNKHAGIFAAGGGTRLREAFPGLIKPMVPVAGVPLIEWTVKLLSSAGFEDITVLLNSGGQPAREHLKRVFPQLRFVFILKDTKSSYESFRLVSQMLAQKSERFLLSTVDSFYAPDKLSDFVASAQSGRFDALLGVTDSIRDEKPLWADLDAAQNIIALGRDAVQKKYATSGIYFMTDRLADEMPAPSTYDALRYYLADIVRSGKKVRAEIMPQSADIDDPEDIRIAESFIKTHLQAIP